MDVFYALWRRSHHGVEHRPRPRLVLAKTEREAEGKENSSPTDAVCLNENLWNTETKH